MPTCRGLLGRVGWMDPCLLAPEASCLPRSPAQRAPLVLREAWGSGRLLDGSLLQAAGSPARLVQNVERALSGRGSGVAPGTWPGGTRSTLGHGSVGEAWPGAQAQLPARLPGWGGPHALAVNSAGSAWLTRCVSGRGGVTLRSVKTERTSGCPQREREREMLTQPG